LILLVLLPYANPPPADLTIVKAVGRIHPIP
jgi:hypothetical protein